MLKICIQKRRLPDSVLIQGAKAQKAPASSLLAFTLLFSSLQQRASPLLPRKVRAFPPPPQHCPRHPLPAHLSGAGNFTKRDFTLLGQGGGTSPGAPCLSLLCWLKHFVQVDQIYVPKTHLPLDQWSLPPIFEGGGLRGGCVRLMRTPGFLSGEKSKRNLSTPSLSSRDLLPSPLFTQTSKVGWVKKQPPFHTHCSVIHHYRQQGEGFDWGFVKRTHVSSLSSWGTNSSLELLIIHIHKQTYTHTLLSTLKDLILPTLLLPQFVFTKASQ